jgi:hypothetical protein
MLLGFLYKWVCSCDMFFFILADKRTDFTMLLAPQNYMLNSDFERLQSESHKQSLTCVGSFCSP